MVNMSDLNQLTPGDSSTGVGDNPSLQVLFPGLFDNLKIHSGSEPIVHWSPKLVQATVGAVQWLTCDTVPPQAVLSIEDKNALIIKDTLLETYVTRLQSSTVGSKMPWQEAWARYLWTILPWTAKHMERISNNFPTFSQEVFNKIYEQWFLLSQLEFDYIQIMQEGLPWFKEFCEVTEKILKVPIDIRNTWDIINMLNFIYYRKNATELAPVVDEIMEFFDKRLPLITDEDITAAENAWIEKMSTGHDLESDNPDMFFREKDPDGYYPDLEYLFFFAVDCGSKNPKIIEWANRFRNYKYWSTPGEGKLY